MNKKLTRVAKDPILLCVLTVAGVFLASLQVYYAFRSDKAQGTIVNGRTNTNDDPVLVTGAVSGTLIDKDTGHGIRDVAIQYLPNGKTDFREGIRLETTNPEGKFSFGLSRIERTNFPVKLQLVFTIGNDRFPWSTEEVLAQPHADRQLSMYVSMKAINKSYLMSRPQSKAGP